MKKVALDTIGCRLNQYETEQISANLVKHGFRRVPFTDEADLYIINTCTVTGRADASCRNIISRAARKEHKVPIVVVGCYVDSDPEKVAALNGVDLVIHNRDKDSIIQILNDNFPSLFADKPLSSSLDCLAEFHEHNRSWIKIGDGCNQNCAYCIIPTVRGPLTNLPPSQIVDEVNQLAANGYHEVVFTGVHIGMYRYDEVKSLSGLLKYILDNSDISRIRLSSIEPQEVNKELIDLIRNSEGRICRHLHVPMQSGSDRILKLMHRPYDSAEYRNIIHAVREGIDQVVIGGDIIVGFPGETDEDFQTSVTMADCGDLDYLHVFSYSDRPGTESSEMKPKIRPDIIKERNAVLREISERNHVKCLQREVGQIAEVISEFSKDKSSRFWGITDNYLRAIIPEGFGGERNILSMKITGVEGDYLTGQVIE